VDVADELEATVGCRLIQEAEVPDHNPARWGELPKLACPTCWLPEEATAREYVAPAGWRSTNDAAVPVQRLARRMPPIEEAPTCWFPPAPNAWEYKAPAGFKFTADDADPDHTVANGPCTFDGYRCPACIEPVVASALDSNALGASCTTVMG
jgi:hypothetical protein